MKEIQKRPELELILFVGAAALVFDAINYRFVGR